jgi:hypothetical protein
MPRFAVSIHDGPRGLHYDLFLEDGEVLKTWALSQVPESSVEISCAALADHRPLYLDYEGPISDDRGYVTRWDGGIYSVLKWADDEIVLDLSGEKIAGRVALRCRSAEWYFKWVPETRETKLPEQ